MAGEHGWVVPGFYYKPANPDVAYRWDGSQDAWAWKQVRDIRDEAFVEGAARTLAIMGTFEQLPDIMLNAGWSNEFDREEFEGFLQVHEEAIKSRAEELRRGGG